MKKLIRISLLLTICFSLYGCPEDKKTTETNTVDMAMNENPDSTSKTILEEE